MALAIGLVPHTVEDTNENSLWIVALAVRLCTVVPEAVEGFEMDRVRNKSAYPLGKDPARASGVRMEVREGCSLETRTIDVFTSISLRRLCFPTSAEGIFKSRFVWNGPGMAPTDHEKIVRLAGVWLAWIPFRPSRASQSEPGFLQMQSRSH